MLQDPTPWKDILIDIDCNRGYIEFATGLNNTAGNLSSIGN